ncbi:MAG: sigma-54 dependent transcriptional regulator [Polyangiaceae bacterium]
MNVPSVLVVEDELGLREGLGTAIRSLGFRALLAPGLADARQKLTERPDCILLDIRLKDGDGLEFLAELQSSGQKDVPVIVATAFGDSERTIRAMRDGAFDYLTKPFHLPSLLSTVERAVKQRSLVRSVEAAHAPEAEEGVRASMVGTSEAMLAIWKLVGRAAASNAPVLITGETGVGKELVARAIHDYSARKAEPFVAANLAALPPSLLESELFGHEKGSFTGAVTRRSGRFESAAAGTLFLDEIGDLEHSLQTKLLRVLQDGTFERVGGTEPLGTRARIVTATNKPVHPGEPGCVLREDLYYRLAVIEIQVPPLRARKSDIPLLVAHALRSTPARAVSEQAMERLVAYDWPGNVRELVHVIERAAVISGGEVIDVTALPDAVRAAASGAPRAVPKDGGTDAPVPNRPMREAVAELERRMIVAALDRAKGNRSEAARQLGIGRPQLYAKMEEYAVLSRDKD